jgi:hypothetical protein
LADVVGDNSVIDVLRLSSEEALTPPNERRGSRFGAWSGAKGVASDDVIVVSTTVKEDLATSESYINCLMAITLIVV